MTGFARRSGAADWGTWVLEAKSVNGKGLDARISVPAGFDALESAIKTAVSKRFKRGNFQIALRIETSAEAGEVHVNEVALKSLMAAYERADGVPATGPALATLMTMKGVVELKSGRDGRIFDADEVSALVSEVDQLLEDLQNRRETEGAQLKEMLLGHLSEAASHVSEAVTFAAHQADSIKAVFTARLKEIAVEGAVSDERLAGEIAVLAAKADVSEEIDRLRAHVVNGQEMLKQGGPVGRSLGFLAQELNREANTICSKSASLDLTNAGLALKSVIDQFKEQAANVE